jgi:hypothetical protein
MQRVEVSSAVRDIYDISRLKVNISKLNDTAQYT